MQLPPQGTFAGILLEWLGFFVPFVLKHLSLPSQTQCLQVYCLGNISQIMETLNTRRLRLWKPELNSCETSLSSVTVSPVLCSSSGLCWPACSHWLSSVCLPRWGLTMRRTPYEEADRWPGQPPWPRGKRGAHCRAKHMASGKALSCLMASSRLNSFGFVFFFK